MRGLSCSAGAASQNRERGIDRKKRYSAPPPSLGTVRSRHREHNQNLRTLSVVRSWQRALYDPAVYRAVSGAPLQGPRGREERRRSHTWTAGEARRQPALAEQLDGSFPEHKQSEESPDLAAPSASFHHFIPVVEEMQIGGGGGPPDTRTSNQIQVFVC